MTQIKQTYIKRNDYSGSLRTWYSQVKLSNEHNIREPSESIFPRTSATTPQHYEVFKENILPFIHFAKLIDVNTVNLQLFKQMYPHSRMKRVSKSRAAFIAASEWSRERDTMAAAQWT